MPLGFGDTFEEVVWTVGTVGLSLAAAHPFDTLKNRMIAGQHVHKSKRNGDGASTAALKSYPYALGVGLLSHAVTAEVGAALGFSRTLIIPTGRALVVELLQTVVAAAVGGAATASLDALKILDQIGLRTPPEWVGRGWLHSLAIVVSNVLHGTVQAVLAVAGQALFLPLAHERVVLDDANAQLLGGPVIDIPSSLASAVLASLAASTLAAAVSYPWETLKIRMVLAEQANPTRPEVEKPQDLTKGLFLAVGQSAATVLVAGACGHCFGLLYSRHADLG